MKAKNQRVHGEQSNRNSAGAERAREFIVFKGEFYQELTLQDVADATAMHASEARKSLRALTRDGAAIDVIINRATLVRDLEGQLRELVESGAELRDPPVPKPKREDSEVVSCRCECGQIFVVAFGDLRVGRIRSCPDCATKAHTKESKLH